MLLKQQAEEETFPEVRAAPGLVRSPHQKFITRPTEITHIHSFVSYGAYLLQQGDIIAPSRPSSFCCRQGHPASVNSPALCPQQSPEQKPMSSAPSFDRELIFIRDANL